MPLPQPPPYTIAFEDEDFLVLDKAEGLLTQPAMDRRRPDLYSLAQKQWTSLYLHHRLDAGTSGLILMTKTPIYNSYVTEIFRQHRIEKIYVALCEAVPGEAFDSSSEWPERWTIENHLAPMKRGKGIPTFMKAVLSGGKKAITDFEWLHPRSPIRVRARPRTGRMHQIRAHLSSCGLPIRGDWLYGKRSKERLYLHAESLRFQHPKTQQLLEVISTSPF